LCIFKFSDDNLMIGHASFLLYFSTAIRTEMCLSFQKFPNLRELKSLKRAACHMDTFIVLQTCWQEKEYTCIPSIFWSSHTTLKQTYLFVKIVDDNMPIGDFILFYFNL
jgi:hypothetical protein